MDKRTRADFVHGVFHVGGRQLEDRLHTVSDYEVELSELKEKLLQMGGLVEEQIGNSLEALTQRNSDLAQSVIGRDAEVDRIELEIDRLGFQILALRQPVGIDLRFIATALKIVTDLERIGDEAVNISERARELNDEPVLKPYVDLPRMAAIARRMLKEALDAFVAQDIDRARAVLPRDDEVDQLNEQLFRELLTFMLERSVNISRCLRLSYISKHLERIADHAVNIAQMVIFLIEGEDVRHRGAAAQEGN